jgi:ribosomal protein S18 acetylase RimI-like enzyme
MPIAALQPVVVAEPGELDEVVEAVAAWQHDGGPVQLHPGDLGWNSSLGADALAGSLRVWRGAGEVRVVGLVEDKGLVRMGLAPGVDGDAAIAERLVADLSDPARGVLPGGSVSVEARYGAAFRGLLVRRGWVADEPWTPLRRDLRDQVEDHGLEVETVDERNAAESVAVHRAAFERSTFTVERWRAMAESAAFRRARCLLARDERGVAVASTTVWSAGPGRPGLIEPLGVHREHRGTGNGRRITLVAAAALRELGASSATVCTPSSNVAGVGTYVAAGFERLADVPDLRLAR